MERCYRRKRSEERSIRTCVYMLLDFSEMGGNWLLGVQRRRQETLYARIIRPHSLIDKRYDRRWQNRGAADSWISASTRLNVPILYRGGSPDLLLREKQRDNYRIPRAKDDPVALIRGPRRINWGEMSTIGRHTEYRCSARKRPCGKRWEIPFVCSCNASQPRDSLLNWSVYVSPATTSIISNSGFFSRYWNYVR